MCKNLEGRQVELKHNVFARNPELTELANTLQGKIFIPKLGKISETLV